MTPEVTVSTVVPILPSVFLRPRRRVFSLKKNSWERGSFFFLKWRMMHVFSFLSFLFFIYIIIIILQMTYFNRLIVNSTVFSLTLLKLTKKKVT